MSAHSHHGPSGEVVTHDHDMPANFPLSGVHEHHHHPSGWTFGQEPEQATHSDNFRGWSIRPQPIIKEQTR